MPFDFDTRPLVLRTRIAHMGRDLPSRETEAWPRVWRGSARAGRDDIFVLTVLRASSADFRPVLRRDVGRRVGGRAWPRAGAATRPCHHRIHVVQLSLSNRRPYRGAPRSWHRLRWHPLLPPREPCTPWKGQKRPDARLQGFVHRAPRVVCPRLRCAPRAVHQYVSAERTLWVATHVEHHTGHLERGTPLTARS